MDNPPKRQKLEDPFYPVLSSEFTEPTPLIEVYIDTITDLKYISKIVVELKSVLSVPELNHLKRIKGNTVLLYPCNSDMEPDRIHDILKEKQFSTSYLENNINKVWVAKIPPRTRKQYEIVHKLWPCNFHSDKYLESLCNNTLFNSSEIQNHINYMKVAIDVGTLRKSRVGVTIVDPKTDSIVATGFDKRSVNPCHHAIMVAIDNVALTQDGGAWQNKSSTLSCQNLNLNGICPEFLNILQTKYENLKFGARQFKGKSEIESPSDGPYLCTGYTVYVTQEPCIMCAMAMIHSRAKRIFFGVKNSRGGLCSLCQIHLLQPLNHHYEVFGGLLETECANLLIKQF